MNEVLLVNYHSDKTFFFFLKDYVGKSQYVVGNLGINNNVSLWILNNKGYKCFIC